jgi:hypothetical protein
VRTRHPHDLDELHRHEGGREPVTSGARSPWALDAGEHVCWQVRSQQDYAAGERELITQARRAGGDVLVVGGEPAGPGQDRRTDPRESAAAALGDVRRRTHAARRRGQLLWVLAAMEQLAPPDAVLNDVIASELELAELAAETETPVVCAYHAERWPPGTLGDIATVHSRVVGIQEDMAGFRLRYEDAGGGYCLEGSVGFEGLRAFTATLRGALTRSPRVRLGCQGLEMIDAAAWRALVETVATVPGASVVLEYANETVVDAWRMSAYEATAVTVQGAR